ncbi:MAG: hypothetical protein K8S97_06260 [Anaerolineae bacterium]|nr:hypothetical protein [Anaerolineae bacterium]
MYNAPPPNLLQGIQLVQAGRKAEALRYLRHAAQTEPLTAEGWLWLAAATDDLGEYRHCVVQTLRLDPYHPIAGRMRHELDTRLAPASSPGYAAGGYPAAGVDLGQTFAGDYTAPREDTAYRHRPARLRRLLRALVLIVLLGGCIGIAASLVVSGAVENLVRDLLLAEDLHTLDFTVGTTPGFRFRVDVPETWLPANTDNNSWRETRDMLITEFPDSAALWEGAEQSFSVVIRDPVYGEMRQRIHLVETDTAQLRDNGMVAALSLHEILPLPDPPPGTDTSACARMRLLETQFAASGTFAVSPDVEVVDTTLAVREGLGDCVFAVERRFTNQRADQVLFPLPGADVPTSTRAVVIAVPVAQERYAVWQITFADRAAGDYDYAVEQIIGSLAWVE